MPTKVYPGIRYRILRPTETLRETDEYYDYHKRWRQTVCAGQLVGTEPFTYRRLKPRYRKVSPRR